MKSLLIFKRANLYSFILNIIIRKKFNKLLLFVYINLFSNIALCQTSSTVKLTVIDSIDNKPICYATIKLLNYKDSLLNTFTITDSSGTAILHGINKGQYFCVISYIGYEKFNTLISINKGMENIDLGEIKMLRKVYHLNEITINGKSKIYNTVDRTIYSLDSLDTYFAVNSLDILKKIPEIRVDYINNKAQILGSNNTIVLINGIYQSKQIDIRTIAPDEIDKIEIIHSPGNEYDSDIDGIINLVLKSNASNNFYILGEGYYAPKKASEALINFLYRKRNIRHALTLNLEQKRFPTKTEIERTYKSDSTFFKYIFLSESVSKLESVYNISNTFNFFINKKNAIAIILDEDIVTVNNITKSKSINTVNYKINDELQTLTNKNDFFLLGNYTLAYKKILKNENEWLQFNTNVHHMLGKINTCNYDTLHFLQNNNYKYIERLYEEQAKKKSGLIKIDIQKSLGTKIFINFGSSHYIQSLDNTFVNTDINAKNKTLGHFNNYRTAFYTDFLVNNYNFKYRIGAKIEKYFASYNDSVNVEKCSLLPSFLIQKKINKSSNVLIKGKTTYDYPSFWHLTPYTIYIDSLVTISGNPKLSPQINYFCETKYMFRRKKFYFSTSFFSNYIKQYITEVFYINQFNSKNSRYENIKYYYTNGIECNMNSEFLLFFVEPTAKLYYEKLSKTKNNLTYQASLNLGIFIPVIRGILFFQYGSYGKTLLPQGYKMPYSNLESILFIKSFINNQFKLMIGMRNPNNKFAENYEFNGDYFTHKTNYMFYTKSYLIRLTFSFNHGTKTINDEIKMEKDIDIKH